MKKRTWVWMVIAAGVVCLVILSCCCFSGVLGSLGSMAPARAFEAPAPARATPTVRDPTLAERADERDALPATVTMPPEEEAGPRADDRARPRPSSGGPTPRQRGLALALYTTLFENADENEDRVIHRVARRQRVSVNELEAAYTAVVSDPEANQQMIRAYNAAHGSSPRGDRLR